MIFFASFPSSFPSAAAGKTKGAVILNEIYYAVSRVSRVNCELSWRLKMYLLRFMSSARRFV